MGQEGIGTDAKPVRVAIIGAGPAGFYAAEHLFKNKDLVVEVDLYDRLPTPFGLVRDGVAPDHQKIKAVTKAYDRIASNPRLRYYGYVEFGSDVVLEDLKRHYHQILFAVGAQNDRAMGIPGEGLKRSHAATEFIAWYNGHPDYVDRDYDLSQETVVVVGVGNVAMDVCRILCRSREELARTDIAAHALDALSKSEVTTVYMLGRRGPGQAAFTNPELRELESLELADVQVSEKDAALADVTRQSLVDGPDKNTARRIEILQRYASEKPSGKPRKLVIRFCVSPTELVAGDDGGVVSVKIVENDLYVNEHGMIRPRASERYDTIDAGLVFRSVGYKGAALPGVPFREDRGVIPHDRGRVLERADEPESVLTGLYCAGWIKRGPVGVIGTNKPDAVETVERMLEDIGNGACFDPSAPEIEAARGLVHERKPGYFSYDDWKELDALEIERARGTEAPRVKFTSVEEMNVALGR